LFNKLQFRQDQVDTGIIGVGEGQAKVGHQPFAAAAVEIDIHANLARAAEGQEEKFVAGCHCFELAATCMCNRFNPWMVRSGSTASNNLPWRSNKGARPPVAITVTGRPTSAFRRATSPSIIAT